MNKSLSIRRWPPPSFQKLVTLVLTLVPHVHTHVNSVSGRSKGARRGRRGAGGRVVGGRRKGVGWCGTVRVHVSRSFFSDYPSGASLIRVSTFFAFLPFFSWGCREDSLFATVSPGRSGEPREKIVAIVARSGQRSL